MHFHFQTLLLQDVIDGDLCEQFVCLPYKTQKAIADELDRTPGEVPPLPLGSVIS